MKITEKKLIFNFSTSRVFAALIYWDKEKSKIVIEEFLEKKIFLDHKKDLSKRFVQEIKFLSKNILKNQNFLEKDFVLTDIAVFLSQPWVHYKIYNFIKEEVQGLKLTKKRLNHFLDQRDNFEENVLIGRKIVSLFADNKYFDSEQIFGKVSQKFEANLFDVFMNFNEKDFFEYTLSTEFSLLKINFKSFLISFLSYLKSMGEEDDFVFMDSTAELLEVGLFKNRRLKKIISLPFGRNKIILEIQKKIKKDFVESEGLLRMFLNNELEERQAKKIEAILNDFDKEFKKALEENFEKEELKIEKKFLVAGNLENQKILRRQDFFENLILIDKKKMKNVKFLDSEKWDGFAAIEAWSEFFE